MTAGRAGAAVIGADPHPEPSHDLEQHMTTDQTPEPTLAELELREQLHDAMDGNLRMSRRRELLNAYRNAILAAAAPTQAAEADEMTADASEACGKCRQSFDPADTAFDGRARFYLTPYCRGCVDRCHDSEIADHRCVICA